MAYGNFKYIAGGFWRLFVYTVIMTTILTHMDWDPIHRSWQEHQYFPDASVYTWWADNSAKRATIGLLAGSWNLALAENNYFAYFEMEAGNQERSDLLMSHAPYSYNPALPDGPYMWMGQGGEGNKNPWKRVSTLAFYLYHLPGSVVWLALFGEIFWLRWPWWLRALGAIKIPNFRRSVYGR